MINEVIFKRSIVVVLSTAIFSGTGIAYGFDMCRNMFGKSNPSEWRDDYRDRYFGYGYGAPRSTVTRTGVKGLNPP
jgi:hypothetical protein